MKTIKIKFECERCGTWDIVSACAQDWASGGVVMECPSCEAVMHQLDGHFKPVTELKYSEAIIGDKPSTQSV